MSGFEGFGGGGLMPDNRVGQATTKQEPFEAAMKERMGQLQKTLGELIREEDDTIATMRGINSQLFGSYPTCEDEPLETASPQLGGLCPVILAFMNVLCSLAQTAVVKQGHVRSEMGKLELELLDHANKVSTR